MSFFTNLSTLFGNNSAGRSKTSVKSKPAKSFDRKPNNPNQSNQKPVLDKNRNFNAHQNKNVNPNQSRPNNAPKPAFNNQAPSYSHVQIAPISPAEAEKLKEEYRQQLLTQVKLEADAMHREAQAKAREIIVEAKDEALASKIKADKESQAILRQAESQQRDLTIKSDRVERTLAQLEDREKQIELEKAKTKKTNEEATQIKDAMMVKLEDISSLTKEDARQQLLSGMEKKMTHELAQYIGQREEAARAEADDKSKEILIEAMLYGATDYVPEYTSSTVALGSEDAKGKIIGKNGRNIHAFERVTGVDVDLDVSATEVKLSSFDPVRREVAKLSLEKLIKDGRIQPARIEEIVAKTQKDINKITFDEGRNLCHSLGIYNLPNELMQILGRYKYRFSYGQNMIAHILEVTRIGIKIAHELSLDVNTVKLGCLFHDIGKVSEEVEGSHVELGVKMLKKFNIPQPVIDCVAEHHEDVPYSSFESQAVHIADAISGARPGARYENYDEYVQRLQKLEEIANSYPEVQKSYAIQAGREIRVMLEPAKSKDDDVMIIANRIRDEVKREMTYPGTITITVIREGRGQAVAN